MNIISYLGVRPPCGLLLHGPSGCGKTTLAHAIAGELNLPFFKVGFYQPLNFVEAVDDGFCSIAAFSIIFSPVCVSTFYVNRDEFSKYILCCYHILKIQSISSMLWENVLLLITHFLIFK